MIVTMMNTAEGGGTRTIVPGAGALPGTTMEEVEEAGREEGKLFVRITVVHVAWWKVCTVHVCRCMLGMAEVIGPREFLQDYQFLGYWRKGGGGGIRHYPVL